MDILALPEFIYRHNQVVIGSLVAFILLTGMVFLWRLINEKPEPASTSASTLDVQALEDTLKRVMARGPAVAAGAPPAATPGTIVDEEDQVAAASGDPAATAKMQALISEREQKIAELQAALDQAKVQTAEGGGAGVSAEGAVALLELQNKIRELEARLAEYSIIEDDIADLSIYKDENQRLKTELEELRGKMGAAPGDAASAAAPATAVAAVDANAKIEEPKLGLDQDDDVMKQFAAAVSEQAVPKAEAATTIPENPLEKMSEAFELGEGKKAAVEAAATPTAEAPEAAAPIAATTENSPAVEKIPLATEPGSSVLQGQGGSSDGDDPLAGSLDTSKMLEEVANLDTTAGDDDALDGALDTDKLLAEVSELSPQGADDPTPGEDLFGEFKDEENKG